MSAHTLDERAVYHYTDTARLPWILQSGELRPGRNAIGGFPDPDFLWATTMPVPDRSASSAGAASLIALREGRTRAARITLSADHFRPWSEIVADFPAWTPYHVRQLERASHGSNPKHWRCRATPLSLVAWLAVETRGWADRDWQSLNPDVELISRPGGTLGLEIGSRAYFSYSASKIPVADGYAVFVE